MPLRCQLVPAETCLRSSEPDRRTECEGAWALGLYRALLNPVTFFVGFARRRPPCPLCSTPPQEAAAGDLG